MKKGKVSKAAKMYLRQAQKHRRKHGLPTPAQQAEAEAKIDSMIADLKAKADELQALRAERERLEDRIERFFLDVTTLAALLSPAAFAGGPDDQRAAIELALKRMRDTKRIVGKMEQESKEKEKKAAAEVEEAEFTKIRKGYQRAVKLITGEHENLDRALRKWKRYIAAKEVTQGSDLEKVLEQYRRQWEAAGWTLLELVEKIRTFDAWWKQEKRDQASTAAQSKNGGKSKQATQIAKKRGRVKRSKSDLRLKEVRRHKRGYCRAPGCGKRVRENERVCDEHLKTASSDPLVKRSNKLRQLSSYSITGEDWE